MYDRDLRQRANATRLRVSAVGHCYIEPGLWLSIGRECASKQEESLRFSMVGQTRRETWGSIRRDPGSEASINNTDYRLTVDDTPFA